MYGHLLVILINQSESKSDMESEITTNQYLV